MDSRCNTRGVPSFLHIQLDETAGVHSLSISFHLFGENSFAIKPSKFSMYNVQNYHRPQETYGRIPVERCLRL